MVPLRAFAATGLWLAVGAFLMQIMVQGAWGVIPVHLNELPPDDARGTFPGFTYQFGNLIASVNAPLQAIVAHYGSDYALALAAVAAWSRSSFSASPRLAAKPKALPSARPGSRRRPPPSTLVRRGPKIARIGHRGAGVTARNSAPPFKSLNFSLSTAQPAYVGCCPFFDGVPPAFRQEAGFKLETVRGQHCWP
jgi:hypothetical protein